MSPGRLGERLQEYSLYLLLFLLPFSKAAVEICFGLLLGGWLLERLDPKMRRRTVWALRGLRPLGLAVIAYLAVCALSISVSDFPGHSIRGFFSKWLEYLLFFVIVADVATRPRIVRRGLTVLAASSFCVVLQAMAQSGVIWVAQRTYLPQFHDQPFLFDFHRMTGPYENPIDLATYLMVLIPILLGFSLSQRGHKRLALYALTLLLGWCIAQTGARGAWGGLWGGLLLIVILGGAAIRRYGLLLLISNVLLGAHALYRLGWLQHLTSPAEIGKVDRWFMWQAAIGMIRDRPILGHGLNTFMANYLTYWVGGERMPRYAHNCYLQIAAETGLAGLAAFLALLGLLFWRYFRERHRVAGDDRLILYGLMAGLLAFVLQAGIDTNFYALRQAALFWTLAGVALGVAVTRPGPAEEA